MSQGLPNLGNTCYVNTTLQCMFNNRMFKRIVLDKMGSKIKSPLGKSLYVVLAKYDTGDLSLELFTDCFEVWKDELKGLMNMDEQNDMQEFFLGLQNKLVEFEGVSAEKQLAATDQRLAKCGAFNKVDRFFLNLEKSWWRDNKKSWSPLVPIFTGQLVSQIKCVACGYMVQNPELFSNIDVDIKGSNGDLVKLIADFFEIDHVDEWKCDKCSGIGGNRVTKITRLPNTLVITLKRFDALGNKKRENVTIPHEITLPDNIHVFDGSRRYALYAMGCHQGNQHGGHYYAAVKNDEDDSWTVLNDELVRPNASRLVAGHEPYMLFYEAA